MAAIRFLGWAAVVLLGCGRLGFDALPDAAVDAEPDAAPDAPPIPALRSIPDRDLVQ